MGIKKLTTKLIEITHMGGNTYQQENNVSGDVEVAGIKAEGVDAYLDKAAGINRMFEQAVLGFDSHCLQTYESLLTLELMSEYYHDQHASEHTLRRAMDAWFRNYVVEALKTAGHNAGYRMAHAREEKQGKCTPCGVSYSWVDDGMKLGAHKCPMCSETLTRCTYESKLPRYALKPDVVFYPGDCAKVWSYPSWEAHSTEEYTGRHEMELISYEEYRELMTNASVDEEEESPSAVTEQVAQHKYVGVSAKGTVLTQSVLASSEGQAVKEIESILYRNPDLYGVWERGGKLVHREHGIPPAGSLAEIVNMQRLDSTNMRPTPEEFAQSLRQQGYTVNVGPGDIAITGDNLFVEVSGLAHSSTITMHAPVRLRHKLDDVPLGHLATEIERIVRGMLDLAQSPEAVSTSAKLLDIKRRINDIRFSKNLAEVAHVVGSLESALMRIEHILNKRWN